MPNIVELRAIGALLNGKEHFYIPSYQRGYRWRRKQVEDLLGDLYSFARRPRVTSGSASSGSSPMSRIWEKGSSNRAWFSPSPER